jgi:hypothetical protein
VSYTGEGDALQATDESAGITFNWGEQPGTYTVSVTVSFTQGPAAKAQMQVTVQAPTLSSITDTQQGIVAFNNNNNLVFANQSMPQGASTIGGETFNATVNTANLNAGFQPATYFFLQLVTPNSSQTSSPVAGGQPFVSTSKPPQANTPMLDTSSPYGGWSTTLPPGVDANVSLPTNGATVADSPPTGIPGINGAAYAQGKVYTASIQDKDSFNTYLMFQARQGMPIAIGEVDWNISFTATFNPQPNGVQPTADYYMSPSSWTIAPGAIPQTPPEVGPPEAITGKAVSLIINYVGIAPADVVTDTT